MVTKRLSNTSAESLNFTETKALSEALAKIGYNVEFRVQRGMLGSEDRVVQVRVKKLPSKPK